MAESDPALATQDAQTANVRVGGVENRLSATDRLARAEARLAGHDAVFKEREKAEIQAQRERELSAQTIQTALQEAAKASAEALEAALESADKLEKERIGRVEDAVESVKTAASLAVQTTEKASAEYQSSAKDTLKQHNGLIAEMRAKDANYQTKDVAQVQKEALEERIEGLKERLDAAEGAASGVTADRQERHTMTGLQLAAIAILAGLFTSMITAAVILAAGG